MGINNAKIAAGHVVCAVYGMLILKWLLQWLHSCRCLTAMPSDVSSTSLHCSTLHLKCIIWWVDLFTSLWNTHVYTWTRVLFYTDSLLWRLCCKWKHLSMLFVFTRNVCHNNWQVDLWETEEGAESFRINTWNKIIRKYQIKWHKICNLVTTHPVLEVFCYFMSISWFDGFIVSPDFTWNLGISWNSNGWETGFEVVWQINATTGQI